MSKSTTTNNTSDEKNYGATSIFYGSLLLIDLALIGYNLYFMQIFKEINQTEYPASTGSFLEKIADRYYSFFAEIFGYYPSTKVLAIAIPLAFVFLIWFIDDFTKYLKQRARKKAAAGLFDVSNETTQINFTAFEQEVTPEKNAADEAENTAEVSDKPDTDNNDLTKPE